MRDSHEIPRYFGDENRILIIFKGRKSLMYTVFGLAISALIIAFCTKINHQYIGFALGSPFGIIGYFLGTYHIPIEARECAGEPIDVYWYRKFKRKRNKVLYTSYEEE